MSESDFKTPPVFPDNEMTFIPFCFAISAARLMFFEFPLVLIANKTSPSFPNASTYLEKI